MFILISIVVVLIADVHGSTPSDGVGAVYTMTNGAIMNQILVYRLDTNGQLTWVRTEDTNGSGVNTTAGDPLASQGAMIVYSNYLFVVNPGSNSLSMFMIDSFDATQLKLISVQSTFGLFPISVTVNSMYACVLTGGSITGIRCFTYNSSGLFIVSSFDRNLTPYISQSVPPIIRRGTLSQIQFSADDRSLIVSVKSYNSTSRGYLLFYPLSNNNNGILASNPVRQIPPNAINPFSMTLVKMNGLLITDPGSRGVLTLNYSSTNGSINNNIFTPIDASIADALCWSTYSSITGNYYIIGARPAAIVELNIDMSSIRNPTKVIRYYPLPKNTGALEATIVSLAGIDYLYVIGIESQVISGYQLNGVGNGVPNGIFARPEENIEGIPKIAGIAAFVQTHPSSS
jgi:hypothetical protein